MRAAATTSSPSSTRSWSPRSKCSDACARAARRRRRRRRTPAAGRRAAPPGARRADRRARDHHQCARERRAGGRRRARPRGAERRGAEPDHAWRELRERLAAEGIDYARFPRQRARPDAGRAGARARGLRASASPTPTSQRLLEQRATAGAATPRLNVAQILVTVPEGADEVHGGANAAARRGRRWRGYGRRAFDEVARESRKTATAPRVARSACAGRAAARPVRRRGARLHGGRGRRRAAAQRGRLSPAEAGRSPRGRRLSSHADPGAPHPAARVGAARAEAARRRLAD